jgi:hypothetical protein
VARELLRSQVILCVFYLVVTAEVVIHVRKLEKDFDSLELQHVLCANNIPADELAMKASTQAPVFECVFERRLLRPTAQPAELG